MLKTILIILFLNSIVMSQTNPYEKLYSLYNSKKYFKFISELNKEKTNLSEEEKNAFEALYYNLINKPGESEKLIDAVTGKDNSALADSLKKDLYSVSINNNVFLGNYKKSAEQTKIILEKYLKYIKEKDKEDYENSLIIWDAMQGVQKQEAVKKSDTQIEIKRDMAGLYNIPVTYNNETYDFVFDTGANFSTITETYAKKLNLTFTKAKIKVGAITGKKIDAVIAYAKSFSIGNMEIKNTVFIVLPDEDLSFSGGMYKINGIIGLPVIEAMQELTISKDGKLTVLKKPSTISLNNFLMDGFIPVVEVDYKNNPMCFNFDTGARTTLLYAPFFKEYEKEIKEKYTVEDIKFGGAGGDTKIPGYKLKDVELSIGNDKVNVPEISLLSVPVKDNQEFMYGNLGQDFISKFDTMTLNFYSMSIDFK
jgi:predicted aspartyl protease